VFTIFGALALLLGVVGLYSVLAYDVAQRTHELGVRSALGARATDIVRLVVREGVSVAVVGVAIGALIALWAGQFVASLLFHVSPRDPAVFGTVAAALMASAVVASALPAFRAARVDPNSALRSD
jgi:ABC-type antimicrobial peptide transport system permease subunit